MTVRERGPGVQRPNGRNEMRWWNLGFFTSATAGIIEGAILARYTTGLAEKLGVVAMAILAMGVVGGFVGVALGLLLRRSRRREQWVFVLLALSISFGYYLYWVVWPWRSSVLVTAGLALLVLPYAGLCWWSRAALPPLLSRRAGTWFAVSIGVIGASAIWIGLLARPPHLTPVATGETPHRNLIVIVVDTLRADRLGVYGHPAHRTPHIDRLAQSGVVFWHAYSQMPYTVASLGSFFTSLYPYSLGSSTLAYRVQDAQTTAAEILRQRGFQTAAFVSGFPLKSHVSGLAQGFDHYDEDLCALDAAVGPLDGALYQLTAARYAMRLIGNQGILLQRTATEVNDAVFTWLDTQFDRARPLFLFVHYFDPHLDYDPPPPFQPDTTESSAINGDLDTVRRIWAGALQPSAADIERIVALYDGEVAYTDFEIGRLLRRLEEIGVLDNSIVVFTADHGENLWEHEYPFVHGDLAYNSTVRVPLIITGLQGVEPGGSDLVVELVDVVPTVLADLGVPAGDQMVGENVTPLLTAAEERPFRVALGQAVGKADPRQAEGSEPEIYRFFAATERWKVISTATGGSEVYDLLADPDEMQPLAPSTLPVGALLDALDTYAAQALAADESAEMERDVLERLRSLGYVR